MPVRAASALGFPFAAPATDGSLVEVAPGVLWASMPMPMGLDHVNVWLLRGDSGWTLVDTGLPTGATRALWERIAAEHLDGLPVQALVCTHFHPDHAGLAAWRALGFQPLPRQRLGWPWSPPAHVLRLADQAPAASAASS